MHLYISNFKLQAWFRIYTSGLILAILVLGILEISYRAYGNRPTIKDDQKLWAIERDKIGKKNNEIVLLGSSRIQCNVSISTIKKMVPGYDVINLSADGTCANAVLKDLAMDMNFRGKVILETTPECLLFGDQNELSQQFYVDYFHQNFNLLTKLERHIGTFFQNNLTIVDPYLNLKNVIMNLIIYRKMRDSLPLITFEDRSRALDFKIQDINIAKTKRLEKVSRYYQKIERCISIEKFNQELIILEKYIAKIQERGGKVVFIRFPVIDEHWEMDEKFFPRAHYWENINLIARASTLHFEDIEGIKGLRYPDTSHLDAKDREQFTNLLFRKLHQNGILTLPEG